LSKSGGVDYLVEHEATTGDGIGVVGFCMGGLLTFVLASLRPDRVKAAVPFYGFPQGDDQPVYASMTASIQGHMAEHDDFFPPEAAKELEGRLQAMGKDVTLTVHATRSWRRTTPSARRTPSELLLSDGSIWRRSCTSTSAEVICRFLSELGN
jgi:dienelactone hydrolase